MAVRTVSNVGGNWNQTAAWVEGAVPTNADDVICTATSGNLSITGTSDCKTLDLTGYTGTLSGSSTQSIRVFGGTCVFGGTITFAGNLQFVNSGCNLTSNGITWPGNANFATSTANTLNGALIVNGNINLGASTINGNDLIFKGNLICGGNQTLVGTSSLIKDGSGGTWSGTFVLRQNLTVVNGAALNIGSSVSYGSGTLTFEEGATVTTANSTLILSSSCTLDTNETVLNNITANNTITATLSSKLNVNGAVGISGNFTVNGKDLILIDGGISINTTGFITGSSLIVLRGSCFWTQVSTGSVRNSISLEGNLIQAGSIRYGSGTFTIRSTGFLKVSELLIVSSTTLNNFEKAKIESVTASTNVTVSMNRFFRGNSKAITTIGNASNRITFNLTEPCYSDLVLLQNVTFSNLAGYFLAIIGNKNANLGGNVNVIYENQAANGFPLQSGFLFEQNY